MTQVCGCGFEAGSGAGLAAHRRACERGSEPVAAPYSAVAALVEQLPPDTPAAYRSMAFQVAMAMDLTESPRDLTSLTKELRALLAEIAEVSTAGLEGDGVDEIAAARARRLARVQDVS